MDPASLSPFVNLGSTAVLALVIVWRIDASLRDLIRRVDELNATMLGILGESLKHTK